MRIFRDRMDRPPVASVGLTEAPVGGLLRIVEVRGGEEVRRRLLAFGFHQGDLVRIDRQAILRGPVLVRNCRSGTAVALGHSVARRVLVETVHEPA